MSKNKWQTPPDHRFLETEYLVHDCSSDDKHNLWYRWHWMYGLDWKDEGQGHCQTIGTIDSRPIVVCVWWTYIVTRRVAFIEATSQLVDYKMIEGWYGDVFPNVKATANSTNFHNIVRPIEESYGVKSLLKRDVEDVERAFKNAKACEHYMKPVTK